ncbi:ComF family protein [Maribacter sp. PR1]|uniref:ComF family protein n=1 Tax=Maribacter cobaltidurans TaxID=1178778 RepID=A0ABU7IRM1_9FLAO|nr:MULTISPECIES: ComF family protein [Maribacter]MDC6388105.1 ComF family protein [Maribacter sp. PR1]MEE1975493.1 ComF family protein [Maribacter cobaltidurans]
MLLTKLSNIANDINTLLLPPTCFGCNNRLNRGEKLLCTVCRHQLPLTDYNFNEENPVDRIFYGRINIKKASSFLHFTEHGVVKNLIHNLKYRNQEQIGKFLGDWYGQIILHNNYLPKIDFVIPVPIHRRKLKKRGYNQTTLFAKQLAARLKCDCIENVLVKTANTRTQTKKNRLARWYDNRSLYILVNKDLLTNKTILLVDDVITTGATMELCAESLLNIEGTTLYVVSMAIVT